MLDTERDGAMAGNTAKPGKRGRMAIDNRNQQAMAWHRTEQPFDMAARLAVSALARPLGRMPASVKPVCRGNCQQACVLTVFANQTYGFDSLRRYTTLVCDDHFRIGTRWAQPIGTVNYTLA